MEVGHRQRLPGLRQVQVAAEPVGQHVAKLQRLPHPPPGVVDQQDQRRIAQAIAGQAVGIHAERALDPGPRKRLQHTGDALGGGGIDGVGMAIGLAGHTVMPEPGARRVALEAHPRALVQALDGGPVGVGQGHQRCAGLVVGVDLGRGGMLQLPDDQGHRGDQQCQPAQRAQGRGGSGAAAHPRRRRQPAHTAQPSAAAGSSSVLSTKVARIWPLVICSRGSA